jgi:transposase
MDQIELYSRIFGIDAPWQVANVELDMAAGQINVTVNHDRSEQLCCSECGKVGSGYDHRARSWRHLDTCQYKTFIYCDVPRVRCSEHGVRQIRVPWAEPGSGFTAMFESLVIDWLRAASISDVAKLMRLGWGQIDLIQSHAVERGLQRREEISTRALCVDEIAKRRGHNYMTVVSDLETGAVLEVGQGRESRVFADFLNGLSQKQQKAIRTVSMDMWPAYITAVEQVLGDAHKKICFDPFHIAQHLNRAVDAVRRQEHAELRRLGRDDLKKSRYLWLRNPTKMLQKQFERLEELCRCGLKTARAWMYKENMMNILRYTSRTFATVAIDLWYSKAIRSRLEPMKKAARTIKAHQYGIINAMAFRRSNAMAESNNSRIVSLKQRARGYRNPERFRTAILFHLGQLDMYPRPAA